MKSIHRSSAQACTLWLAATLFSPFQASSAELPPAKEVIARYVKALGGRDEILKHSSTTHKGVWSLPAQGITGAFELLRAKPNKQLLIIKMGDQGEIRNGFDGKVGWTINPFAGAMLLEGAQLEQAREDANFHRELHNPDDFKSMETVAKTTFQDQECYELKLVSKSGNTRQEFFDVKTGLLAGARQTQETPQGLMETTMALEDYKRFGPIQEPTKITIEVAGFDQMLTISSVERDNVPASAFDRPAEIQALVK